MKKTLFIAAAAYFLIASPVTAALHKIDKTHSTVGFEVKHLAIATVPGHFSEYTSKINWNQKKPLKSSFEGIIKVNSINTNNEKRDAHLRSDDFFNAEKYPTIYYKSNSIQKGKEKGTYLLKGNLTIRDTKKPVTSVLKVAGPVLGPRGKQRMVFVTEFDIDRFDYGVKFNKTVETGGLVVSRNVKLKIQMETILP